MHDSRGAREERENMRDKTKRIRELFVLFWPTKRNVTRSAVVEEEKKKNLKEREKDRREAEQKKKITTNSHSAVGSCILYAR